MPIWIERIAIENLGPLGDLTLDLARLNLIYGGNETGKTYLIEFLLRALFRNAADWRLRGELGRGKVSVRGLNEGPVDFTPDGRTKLEDYWEQQASGLPTNMGRLLVVKGAELALTEANRNGVDRDVLKTALSSEALIDRIRQRIQPTVREATVENGIILGRNMGELKARSSLQDNLQRLKELSEQVENRYSRGRLRALELTREGLESELSRQLEARRHKAYRLQQERTQALEELSRLPKDRLEDLAQDLRSYQGKQAELSRLREKHAQAGTQVEHYPWLKEAVALWERRDLEGAPARAGLWPALAAALMMLSLLVALAGFALDLTPSAKLILGLAASGAFGVGLLLGFISFQRVRGQAVAAIDVEARAGIEAEFERRFDRPSGGLPGIKAREQELRDLHARFEGLSEQIEEAEADIQRLAAGIGHTLREFTGERVEPEAWAQSVEALRKQEAALTDAAHQLELRLGELGVDESDHRAEPAAVEYSSERLRELEGELERVRGELGEAQQDLDNLKQEITRETGDEISAPWDTILEHLRDRRVQAEADYRQATARILGQIGVAQVLEQIRAEEDQKIREGLAAPEVSALLSEVTGQVRSLDYLDGGLIVRGEAVDYDLADLSTGAREQVLLALRMGFASRLAGGQPLFMLLDDAFQHSDWERRERLVDQVLRLVQAGWQITYLTMDDHLRDLIDRAARPALGDDYCMHVIEA